MSFDVPDDLYYLESHEWARINSADGGSAGSTARVGISDFAQDELGDVVFVELPEVGDEVAQEEAFGVVESIKAVSDVYAPVSGTVSAVNEALFDAPELVNEEPYGDGWFLEIDGVDESDTDELLSADEYEAQIA